MIEHGNLADLSVVCSTAWHSGVHRSTSWCIPASSRLRGKSRSLSVSKRQELTPLLQSVIKMVTIKGSYVGNRKDTAEALDFFRRGVIKAPFKTVGLSELQKVYDLMHEGKIAGRYVLDTSK